MSASSVFEPVLPPFGTDAPLQRFHVHESAGGAGRWQSPVVGNVLHITNHGAAAVVYSVNGRPPNFTTGTFLPGGDTTHSVTLDKPGMPLVQASSPGMLMISMVVE